MGVQLYRIAPYQHPQENAAFELLCRAAETHLRDLEDVRIIGNLRYPGWQMDVLVLARHSITVIDFKDWSGTIKVGLRQPWLNEEGKAVLGGSYANPYKQMCAYRERMRAAFDAAPELEDNDPSHINGLVLFTQPVKLIENPGDPIGPYAGKWFHVADWTGGIHMLRNAASERINLPYELLDEMVADLKALPFMPLTGEKLVPESAVTEALREQDFARMADWEAEHRDEMRAQYEEAQEGWFRLDYPSGR